MSSNPSNGPSKPPAPASVPVESLPTQTKSSSSKHQSAPSSQNYSKKKSSGTSSSSHQLPMPNHISKSSRAHSPMFNPPPKHSPLGPSPGRISPEVSKSHSQTYQPPQSSMPSLTSIEDLIITNNDDDMPPIKSVSRHSDQKSSNNIQKAAKVSSSPPKDVHHHHHHKEASGNGKNVGLSDSSSDSSSSSSSDSSDDDEDMEVVPDDIPIPKFPVPALAPKISGGGSFQQNKGLNTGSNGGSGLVYGNNMVGSNASSSRGNSSNNSAHLSMPTDLLSEDLQLSDSGSDSD